MVAGRGGTGIRVLGGVSWVGLFAADVEALVPFYRDALGLTLVGRTDNSAIFALTDGALLELVPGGVAADGGRKGHGAQSMQLGLAVTDLEAVRAALVERGITPGDVQTFRDWRWARVVDPEGNVLQLVERGGDLFQGTL